MCNIKSVPVVRDQFVDSILEKFHIDEDDKEGVTACIYSCQQKGFSDWDTTRYVSFMEEANPTILEAVALKRMSEIERKYSK